MPTLSIFLKYCTKKYYDGHFQSRIVAMRLSDFSFTIVRRRRKVGKMRALEALAVDLPDGVVLTAVKQAVRENKTTERC